mgnify:CR=1 FL=1
MAGNSNSGRRKLPVAIKIARGTYRADRDTVPVALPEGVPAPAHELGEEARILWEAVVPGLVEKKLAGAADGVTLTMMCHWWGVYVETVKVLAKGDLDIGQQWPWLNRMSMATKKFDEFARRFGLTPADREKLRSHYAQQAPAAPVAARKRG